MISERIVLRFPHRLVEQPIVYNLVREHNLEFNILKAYVTPREEGLLVLELKGQDDDYNKGMNYLTRIGVAVQPLSQDVIRNDARCTHCGACVTICPTGALVLDSITRKVHFYDNKCIACELCVPACPPRAMEVHF
ncbi:4Fe-4S dicluster domain-containing protein [candidate division NPL-UPA2 bacterium Unc8]|uniref:4Fe-4S dicluster domain-containing protein n=1 Tax=candidate division NPL-UPA2 bacterium Unc8 TaxID=1980939 RepID=A0A399FUK0_UNCN2|nr:Choline trimethylamine-lyase activating enzyme [Bacillota bacterium]MBT9138300.1 Choline trimethylamine-lyase activating enzyme [Bacillota bacterium]MBT9147223.1 Choline trimethylamine-lyase activating enzyme [Bacillota bacterium]RIH99566.1 MAG: 4Fe-4S dicluster domain-containing protein [candidate division NPL-UPA2 bacterium Unc8]